MPLIYLFGVLPLRGLLFVAERIAEELGAEEGDEARLHQQLVEARLLYEMDEITLDEYERREKVLLEKIGRARDRSREGEL